MIDLLYGGDNTSEQSEVPVTAPLRASIDIFVVSLAAAHPRIFAGSPVYNIEHIAALLHMYLDYCRHMLAVYDSLRCDDAGWLFEPYSGETDDDSEEEEHEVDDDDIPF